MNTRDAIEKGAASIAALIYSDAKTAEEKLSTLTRGEVRSVLDHVDKNGDTLLLLAIRQTIKNNDTNFSLIQLMLSCGPNLYVEKKVDEAVVSCTTIFDFCTPLDEKSVTQRQLFRFFLDQQGQRIYEIQLYDGIRLILQNAIQSATAADEPFLREMIEELSKKVVPLQDFDRGLACAHSFSMGVLFDALYQRFNQPADLTAAIKSFDSANFHPTSRWLAMEPTGDRVPNPYWVEINPLPFAMAQAYRGIYYYQKQLPVGEHESSASECISCFNNAVSNGIFEKGPADLIKRMLEILEKIMPEVYGEPPLTEEDLRTKRAAGQLLYGYYASHPEEKGKFSRDEYFLNSTEYATNESNFSKAMHELCADEPIFGVVIDRFIMHIHSNTSETSDPKYSNPHGLARLYELVNNDLMRLPDPAKFFYFYACFHLYDAHTLLVKYRNENQQAELLQVISDGKAVPLKLFDAKSDAKSAADIAVPATAIAASALSIDSKSFSVATAATRPKNLNNNWMRYLDAIDSRKENWSLQGSISLLQDLGKDFLLAALTEIGYMDQLNQPLEQMIALTESLLERCREQKTDEQKYIFCGASIWHDVLLRRRSILSSVDEKGSESEITAVSAAAPPAAVVVDSKSAALTAAEQAPKRDEPNHPDVVLAMQFEIDASSVKQKGLTSKMAEETYAANITHAVHHYFLAYVANDRFALAALGNYYYGEDNNAIKKTAIDREFKSNDGSFEKFKRDLIQYHNQKFDECLKVAQQKMSAMGSVVKEAEKRNQLSRILRVCKEAVYQLYCISKIENDVQLGRLNTYLNTIGKINAPLRKKLEDYAKTLWGKEANISIAEEKVPQKNTVPTASARALPTQGLMGSTSGSTAASSHSAASVASSAATSKKSTRKG